MLLRDLVPRGAWHAACLIASISTATPLNRGREAKARIAELGVRVGLLRPGVLRLATHLNVTDDDVDRTIELIPRALSVPAPV